MEVWIDHDNRRFHDSCSDRRRKPIGSVEVLLKEIPNVDAFALYLHDEDAKSRFEEWCGSIVNDSARQAFYGSHHAFVRELVILEARLNGEFNPPRKRRKKAEADKPDRDDESQDSA